MNRIILASASPRRSELLASAAVQFEIQVSSTDEAIIPGESPTEYVKRAALDKAKDVAAKTQGRFVIGADTIVVLDDEIMGKPANYDDAVRMLCALSGKTHQVVTGFAVIDRDRSVSEVSHVSTDVHFAKLSQEEIERYVSTGCPLDKAGGYAIQGGAAYMVEWINGSYTNVVGLPLAEVVSMLKRFGAIT